MVTKIEETMKMAEGQDDQMLTGFALLIMK